MLPIDLPAARLPRNSCGNALREGHVRVHGWYLLLQPLLYVLRSFVQRHALEHFNLRMLQVLGISQRYNLMLISGLKSQVALMYGTLRVDSVELVIWAMQALASLWPFQNAMANP